ncbi:MAG: hypothetical protein JXA49_03475, partial [Actinobacteria bacterium]|nr:hypothetical protein [Actinomycetota bacterium]
HGHFGHIESPYQVDFWEPKEQNMSGMIMGVIQGVKNHIPIIYSPMTVEPPKLLNYMTYIGKIQQLIDPYGIMDALVGGMMGMMKDLDDIDELEKMGEAEPVR